MVEQQRQRNGYSRTRSELHVLSRLDEELPPDLAAAVERGKSRDYSATFQDILHELEGTKHTPPERSSPETPTDPLTARETEILVLMADGLTSREIAQRLVLSVGTIRWYMKHIYSKLDVHSRSQALSRARALKIAQ